MPFEGSNQAFEGALELILGRPRRKRERRKNFEPVAPVRETRAQDGYERDA